MNLTEVFQEVLRLSLKGTLLIIVLIIIKGILRDRLSANWHYTVWLLLILRLVLPVAPEAELSLYNLFNPVMVGIQQYDESNTAIPRLSAGVPAERPQENHQQPVVGANQPETAINLQNAPAFMDILAVIWLLGAVIMALIILYFNIRFYKKIRFSIPCRDAISIRIIQDCHKVASVKRSIPLVIHEGVRVPILYGIIRPRLVLSGQVLKQLSEQEMKYVFIHELIHYKRKDIFFNWLMAFLRCVYWFNPVIVYAFHRIREDCEVSCDESVLKRLSPSEYHQYGRTILNLADMFSEPHTLACTSGLIQKKSSVKRRIGMITKYKKKTAIGTLMAFVMTVLIGCSTLTNAQSDRNQKPEDPTVTPVPTATVESVQPTEPPTKESAVAKETLAPVDETIEEKVQYNLDKLKDQSYTGTYGDGYTWYTAAEELGAMGKPAIPGLMEKLESKDDYERSLAIYALLLASQHDNVKIFTNGAYLDVNLDFNPDSHPEMIEKAKAWWGKYKDNF